MMTVKHISLSGHEQIHAAVSLHYTPALESADGTIGSAATLRLDQGTDSVTLQGGTAFAMNDAGRTIARYDLGASMVPQGRGSSTIGGSAAGLPSTTARFYGEGTIR